MDVNSTFEASLCRLFLSCCLTVFAVFGVSQSYADSLSQLQDTGIKKVNSARASQKRVDVLSEKGQQQLREYRLLQKQIEGLETYNKQLSEQIDQQSILISKYDASILEVATIERQMMPLVVKMVKSLGDFVELDLPFHMTERRERLSNIEENVEAADIDVAEKFRQIIEAYQIENEYGRKVDSYQDIAIVDGVAYEVDVLRVGRIALVCQSKDTTVTAMWDRKNQSWLAIDSGNYRNSVRQGLKMANKQAPIGMLRLPIMSDGGKR